VIELAWFAAGAAATFVALRIARRVRRQPPPRSQRPRRVETTNAPPPPPQPVPLLPVPIATDARAVAVTLAEELATLVSGVEGRAHHLIEASPNRAQLPAAEALVAAIARLRTLHNKLAAFGRFRSSAVGSTDVIALMAGLRDELAWMQLGIEILWEPPKNLPPINGAPEVVRDALLFLCSAMLRAERGATHLAIHAEPCFAMDTPRVQIELALEWVTEAKVAHADLFADPSFALDLEAANNLVTGLGGELAVTHLPGRSVRAVVYWAAVPEPEPAANGASAARDGALASSHEYGGALLLEADPSIRAMIASELKATGRAVFACADGASAKSFLEATPERFEVLIVDHHERLDADHALVATIQRLAPGLKVCVLARSDAAGVDALPHLHRIEKPFGVHELRRALATVLAGC